MLALMRALPVKGVAHITGGGLVENVPRVLPTGIQAVLHQSSWPRPKIFDWLQAGGNVAEAEMHRVFNCGIGMVLVVAAQHADAAMQQLSAAGERVYRIGNAAALPAGAAPTIVT
jgi:phosphoribosylformylglycinamidine cyclo-ligase